MIGSIISGAVGAASSIFGGVKASQAMKKVKKNLEQQREDNKNWYDQRYNEDSTQRADAQSILTQTEEAFRTRNRQAAGTAAVTGGTEESVAATKAANAQGMADAARQISVAGDQRKDNIEQQYRETDSNLQSQINNVEMKRADAIGQAVQGVSQSVSNSIGKF